jgi:hypothetical protein
VYWLASGVCAIPARTRFRSIPARRDQTRQQGRVIEKFLAKKPPLPKSSGAKVLPIGKPGDRLGQAPHKPGNAGQPPSNLGQPIRHGGDHLEFEVRRHGRSSVIIFALREDVPPPPGDLFIRPTGDDIRTIAGHQVDVITHDRKTKDVHGELAGQKFQPLLKRPLSMLVTFAGLCIGAAQKGATNATVDAVVNSDFRGIE